MGNLSRIALSPFETFATVPIPLRPREWWQNAGQTDIGWAPAHLLVLIPLVSSTLVR